MGWMRQHIAVIVLVLMLPSVGWAQSCPTSGDSDSDGISNGSDDCQDGETGWCATSSGPDHDGDGCKDDHAEDNDDDNDGVDDATDQCDPDSGQSSATGTIVDVDGDGCDDTTEDDCVDADGDGYGTGSDISGCASSTADSCPNTPSYDADADSDGCDDSTEDVCVDVDGDGIGSGSGSAVTEACPSGLGDLCDTGSSASTLANDVDGDGCDDGTEDVCVDVDGDGMGTSSGSAVTEACTLGLGDACDTGSSASVLADDADSDGCDDSTEDVCVDVDGDGIGSGSGSAVTEACPSGLGDLCDTGSSASTLADDVDGDGCDDSTEDVCVDVDGDGMGTSSGSAVTEACPSGLGDACDTGSSASVLADDADSDGCDDSTEDVCVDVDGDGIGSGSGSAVTEACPSGLGDLCDTGSSASTLTDDVDGDGCDDSTEDVCVDVDGDGMGTSSGSAVTEACPLGLGDACDTGSSASVLADDADTDGCDDSTEDVCVDVDGDGMGSGSGSAVTEACPSGLGDACDTISSASTLANDVDGDGCDDSSEDDCVDADGDNFGTGSDISGCTGSTTTVDGCPNGTATPAPDIDGDGCDDDAEDDCVDQDNDGRGTSAAVAATCPLDDTSCPNGTSDWNSLDSSLDYDEDGCKDSGAGEEDDDDDGDGILDAVDACDPESPNAMNSETGWTSVSDSSNLSITTDYDQDGCKDDTAEDDDDDGDGVADDADLCDPDDIQPSDGPSASLTSITDTDPVDGCDDNTEGDDDGDGLVNASDVCPNTDAALLSNTDGDGDGCWGSEDRCDEGDVNSPSSDVDLDGCASTEDLCPNGDAVGADSDGDGCSDTEDFCPSTASAIDPALDPDEDGCLNDEDACDTTSTPSNGDSDGDGCDDVEDLCVDVADDQSDSDSDGHGDACDNCPVNRGLWTAPIADADGDGCDDSEDFCPNTVDPSGLDTDEDGCPDVEDDCDNSSVVAPAEIDTDADGCGDGEDGDDDDDTIADLLDECPQGEVGWTPDSSNDVDGDGCQDLIEDDCVDFDRDGVGEIEDASSNPYYAVVAAACTVPDNCPLISNDQTDVDVDGLGDLCDDCVDVDGDGFGDAALAGPATTCAADCDDADADFFPGQIWYADCDGDGYLGEGVTSCTAPVNACANGGTVTWCIAADCTLPTGDCDDADGDEYPTQIWYADCDGDGAYSGSGYAECDEVAAQASLELANECGGAPAGGWDFTDPGAAADCDDQDSQQRPNQTWVADCDGDGWYALENASGDSLVIVDCDRPDPAAAYPDGMDCPLSTADLINVVPDVGDADCDDTSASVFPYNEEVCEPGGAADQIDNDCNGSDENWTTAAGDIEPAVQAQAYYYDGDGDGYGDADSDPVYACTPPDDYVNNNFDCDDTAITVNVDAGEICNAIDDNCNGLIDEADFLADENSGCLDLYRDQDGDGFGDLGATLCLCGERQDDGSVLATFDNDQYVSTFSDCDDLHASIKPHECNDGLDNDGDGVVDAVDEDCSPFNGQQPTVEASRCDDGVDNDGDGLADAADPDCALVSGQLPDEEGLGTVRPSKSEIIDGHDNDCDGRIPLVELDCDDDGSFPRVAILDDTPFTSAGELGLARCSGDPIQVDCFGDSLTVECDEELTGLWVFRYSGSEDGWTGRYTGGYRNLTSGVCSAWGDCDDTCASRCPGATESCDGLDNDCSGTTFDQDVDGVPPALDSLVAGTVALAEIDLDGDGFSGCDADFRPGNDQVQLVTASCGDELSAEFSNDCDDLCWAASPDSTEVCNGFLDVCEATEDEGGDVDGDGHGSCGAWGTQELDLVEEIYVVVWADCTPDAGGFCTEGGNDSYGDGFDYVPLLPPRQLGGLPDGVICDTELAAALERRLEVAVAADAEETRTAAEILADPEVSAVDLLSICDGAVGGQCSTVRLSLETSADGETAALDALAAGFTSEACTEAPEQYAMRTVWPGSRIRDARQAVVEYECRRLFGAPCDQLSGSEAQQSAPAPVNIDALFVDPSVWWMEMGRYVPLAVGGPMMSCWGDPLDPVRGISEVTGGDCDDSADGVNRDAFEGPSDVVALVSGEPVDCELCTDGIDNNCDGAIDCADPSCAVCFVGQGSGGGCSAGGPCGEEGEGGCATGTSVRSMALPFAVVMLISVVARRRDTQTRS